MNNDDALTVHHEFKPATDVKIVRLKVRYPDAEKAVTEPTPGPETGYPRSFHSLTDDERQAIGTTKASARELVGRYFVSSKTVHRCRTLAAELKAQRGVTIVKDDGGQDD